MAPLAAEAPSGENDVNLKSFKLLICLLVVGESALARAECFTSVSAVKAHHVKTKWQETTENDGKPMIISIADGVDGLVFSTKKAGVLWLSGSVSVCRHGSAIDIDLRNPQATSNVPMMARLGLPSVLSAHIVSDQIKLAGGGWSGTFVAR